MLLDHFHKSTAVHWKGERNVATDADLASEQSIMSILKREFPDHDVLAEESGRSEGAGAGYTWLVDPLDGTNNFLYGMPFFAVTLALTKGDDIILGVTYDPVRGELFSAARGGPAMLNGKEISASSRTDTGRSFVGFDLGYNPKESRRLLDAMSRLWGQVYGMRLLGSAALGVAYVAAGRLDIYCHRCLYPWDIGAGILLVRNAGGVVTDWEGKAATPGTGMVLAGSAAAHASFLKWLSGPGGGGQPPAVG